MERIYLDYAASAPLAPEAKKVIEQFMKEGKYGNPSSLHAEGRQMRSLLDRAHTTVGAVFGVHPTEVIFTSGATESNVLAIRGTLQSWRLQQKAKPHVILSAIEHASWRQVAHSENAEVTIIPVSSDGVVKSEDVLAALKENTALVGIMYASNEIGTIQPVEAIGKGIEAHREKNAGQWPVFHVDAVQAFPYLNTHSKHVHADLLTFSGHKYGSLGGIGILIAKKQTPLQGIFKGGGQEWGYRAGTENVLGALTLAAVSEYGDTHRSQLISHVSALQHTLEREIEEHLPTVHILGKDVARLPHITYVWLPEVIDEHVVHKLDLVGVAVSSGSACSSGAMLPSATLVAMGYSDREAYGGIRFSYGRATTPKEIHEAVNRLKRCLNHS